MKRCGRTLLVTALVMTMAGLSPAAHADPASDAAQLCRDAEAGGEIDRLNVTRGECVNLFHAPAGEKSNNLVAGLCGFDRLLEVLRARNKGACISMLRGL